MQITASIKQKRDHLFVHGGSGTQQRALAVIVFCFLVRALME